MRTLSIDVGGSAIKGAVFEAHGAPASERIRRETPRPATPEVILDEIVALTRDLPAFDRVSVGFPGIVEGGIVRTAPNLDGTWAAVPLEAALQKRLGRPVRTANDADVHGLAVVQGVGVEMVLTLGTGLGTALFVDGRCAWNLELGHHVSKGKLTYEDRVSEAARKRIGNKRWCRRVSRVLLQLIPIFNPKRLYVGGGNARRLIPSELPAGVTIIDNRAGVLGGLALWGGPVPLELPRT